MAFDAGTVESRLVLDRSPFQRSLKAAKSEAQAFVRRVFSARLEADEKPAEAATQRAHRVGERYGRSRFEASYGVDLSRVVSGFSSAKKQAERWAAENPEAAADVDISEVAAKIATARQLVRTFGQTTATKTVEVKVIDEIDRARRRIESLERVVESASDEEIRIEAEANVTAARIRLEQLKQLARSVGLTDADIDVDVNTGASFAKLAALRIAALGGGSSRGVVGAFNAVAETARSTFVLAIPAAVGLAVAALQPLMGGAAIGGSAVAAVGAGFGLIALAARDTFSEIKFENGKFVKAEGAVLRGSQERLIGALNSASSAYDKAMTPAYEAFDKLALKGVQVAQRTFPAIGRAAEATTLAVSRAFDSVVRVLSKPQQLASYERFLNAVPGITAAFTRAAGNLFGGIVNILSEAVPYAKDFAGYVEGLTEDFLSWSQSKEGTRAMRDFFESAKDLAPKVADAVVRFSRGLLRVSKDKDTQKFLGDVVEMFGAIGDAAEEVNRTVGALQRVSEWLNRIFRPGKGWPEFDWRKMMGVRILTTVWNWIKRSFSQGAQTAQRIVSGTWSRIRSLTTSAWNGVRSVVSGAWSRIRSTVSSAANGVRAVVSGAWSKIRSLTTGAWNSIRSAIAGAWGKIRAAASSGANAVRAVVSGAWSKVRSLTTSAWNSIRSAISGAWSKIRQVVSSAANGVRSVVSNAWGSIRSATTSAWNSIRSAVSAAWGRIRSTVTGAVSSVRSAIQGGWNAVKTATTSAFNAIKNAISGALTGALGAARNFITNLKNTFSNLGLYQYGKNAVQGFINGVGSLGQAMYNRGVQIVQNFLKGVADRLKVGSPSKVMRDMGKWTGEGFALGVEDKIGRIRSAAEKMAREAAAAAQGAYSPDLSASVSGFSGVRGLPGRGATPVRAHRTNVTNSMGGVTVNVYAREGQSSREVAAEVARQLWALLRGLEGQAGTTTASYGGVV